MNRRNKCMRLNCGFCSVKKRSYMKSPRESSSHSSSHSTNQPINQPINQSTNRSTSHENIVSDNNSNESNNFSVTFQRPITISFSYPEENIPMEQNIPMLPGPKIITMGDPMFRTSQNTMIKNNEDLDNRDDTGSYKDDMVKLHNDMRLKKGLNPIGWSNELAEIAQDWANYLARTGKFDHRPTSEYGENLFFSIGKSNAKDAFDGWAAEEDNYNLESNTCRGVCGHYTQIVWDDTTKIGCGKAISGDKEYHVCNYYPHGNVHGRRPYVPQ